MHRSLQNKYGCPKCAGHSRPPAGTLGFVLLISLAFVIAYFSACSRRQDPQIAFDDAMRTFQHGDTSAAAQEAENGHRDFRGVSTEWAWKFAILRARILLWQGAGDRALDVLASEPGFPSSGDLLVQKKRIEGVIYASLHKFGEAERSLEEAERLCAASDYQTCPDIVRARGTMEMDRGRYALAQGLFEHALASTRARNDSFLEATALLNLSWSADEQTHFDEALDWANAGREISAPHNFAGLAQAALGNMGWAYYKLGEPEKALEMFIEAAQQAKKLGDVSDQVKWLTNAGYIYMDDHNFKTAEPSFQQSLQLARQINSREDTINSLIALAFVSEQTNSLDDAKRYADEALAKAREDKNGRDQVYPRLVQGRVAARLHDPTAAENAFREVEQSPECPVFLKWEAERSLGKLYEAGNQFDSADREYRTALTTFEAARSELKHEDSRLPFLSNASRIYDDYIHLLVARGKAAEALQVADFSRGRTLAEGLGLLRKGSSFKVDPLDAPGVARRASGTIFFYWLGDRSSYLWAVTPKKTTLFSLPASAEIEAAVERYQKALARPQDVLAAANDAGSSLYHMLIEPARELLQPNAKVIIIPDGKLNNLNFETLLVPQPAFHYWIEDVAVVNATSLRLLTASHGRSKEKRPRSLLLFGNAVSASPDFPALPNATVEMVSIAKHFPAARQRIFEREQATPAAYLSSNPEQFSYIHFVAHGMASRLSPLDSTIVLSMNKGQNEIFKLYARDVIQHPVRADLVTISACYSAGTRAYSGEGLVGLSWAFLRAGAHNVVAALWEANDISTGQLMDKFYDELNSGRSPDTALRHAKLFLLHSGSAFRKPFYWAPFQLYSGL
jgi:CHAT domain-containing protein/Tfp pilus assembly protein PilF